MTDTDIKKIQAVIKKLQEERLKESYQNSSSKRMNEPGYIGKNFIRIWWKYWRRDFSMSIDWNGIRCSFLVSPCKTVFCSFKRGICSSAFSYKDCISIEQTSPAKQKLHQIYGSLLLSPYVTKEDIIKIYHRDEQYGVNQNETDPHLIDKILSDKS